MQFNRAPIALVAICAGSGRVPGYRLLGNYQQVIEDSKAEQEESR